MKSEFFILTEETKINFFGIKLHRIKCIKTFKYAKEGDLGGWVSENARVYGNAWVSENAWVYGNAEIYGDAKVSENAWVFGNAKVFGDAKVFGNAWVFGDAWVYGNAEIYGDVKVFGDEAITYKVIYIKTQKYTITFGKKITIGCKQYSAEEWKSFNDSEISSFDNGALEFWLDWKEIIFATWELHKKLNLKYDN